jgi:hypothetical protein
MDERLWAGLGHSPFTAAMPIIGTGLFCHNLTISNARAPWFQWLQSLGSVKRNASLPSPTFEDLIFDALAPWLATGQYRHKLRAREALP